MPDLDQHYTPTELARTLVRSVTRDSVAAVADFAAGDGELLRAAEARWPTARLVALDIDPVAVRGLKRTHPTWAVGRCDFKRAQSRNRTRALRGGTGGFDAIVLNPPFSFRGGTKSRTRVLETEVECSPPLAFVVEALAYLNQGGELVAILPRGVLLSEKDALARRLLSASYGLEVVGSFERGVFESCTPRTVMVRIGTGTVGALPDDRPVTPLRTAIHEVSIRRGRVPTKRASGGGLPFVHTTELRGQRLSPSTRRAAPTDQAVEGPALLLPRVGKPMASKLVVVNEGTPAVVLSDCVLAVECSSARDACVLQRALLENWEATEASYGGTCARYITVASLAGLLERVGVHVLPYGETIRDAGLAHPASGDGRTETDPLPSVEVIPARSPLCEQPTA